MRRRGVSWRRRRRFPHIRPTVPLLRCLVGLPQLPDAGVLCRLRLVRGSHDLRLRFGQPSFHIAIWVWRRRGVGWDGWRGRSVCLPSSAYHGVEGIVSTCGGGAPAHFRVSVLAVLSSPRGNLGKLPALRTKSELDQRQKVCAGWTVPV